MTEVILATLAFYLFQLMLPHLIAVARGEIAATSLLGARDQVVDNSIIVQRASRAAANMQESMIVFLRAWLLLTAHQSQKLPPYGWACVSHI